MGLGERPSRISVLRVPGAVYSRRFRSGFLPLYSLRAHLTGLRVTLRVALKRTQCSCGPLRVYGFLPPSGGASNPSDGSPDASDGLPDGLLEKKPNVYAGPDGLTGFYPHVGGVPNLPPDFSSTPIHAYPHLSAPIHAYPHLSAPIRAKINLLPSVTQAAFLSPCSGNYHFQITGAHVESGRETRPCNPM